MIGLAMAGRVRRHVGEHDIGPAAERIDDPLPRVGREEVEPREGHARDRLDVEKVDGDHFALSRDRADPPGRIIRPAARGCAEIDDARPFPEQAVLVVDLDELIGCAGAIPLPAGASHVGIVELALEPKL